MAYTIPNLTDSGGIESVGAELARQVNYFWAGILFMVFFVIWGVGYFAQQRTTGYGNAAMWAAIAGLITTFSSFILFLYDNLVTIEVPIISLVITIISAAAFLLSSNN